MLGYPQRGRMPGHVRSEAIRQADIDDHEVDHQGREQLDRRRLPRRESDMETVAFQRRSDRFMKARFVLDNENVIRQCIKKWAHHPLPAHAEVAA